MSIPAGQDQNTIMTQQLDDNQSSMTQEMIEQALQQEGEEINYKIKSEKMATSEDAQAKRKRFTRANAEAKIKIPADTKLDQSTSSFESDEE